MIRALGAFNQATNALIIVELTIPESEPTGSILGYRYNNSTRLLFLCSPHEMKKSLFLVFRVPDLTRLVFIFR